MGDIYAQSLLHAEIQAAVDSAQPNDEIYLPEGINDQWGGYEEILINKPLWFKGAGKDKTILQLKESNGVPPGGRYVIKAIGVEAGDLIFSDMTLVGMDDPELRCRGFSASYCKDSIICIFNMHVVGMKACAFGIGGLNLKGVAWNVEIERSNFQGLGYGFTLSQRTLEENKARTGWGDASWSKPPSIGTFDNFFIEDCVVRMTRHHVDGSAGARLVFRHNKLYGDWPADISNPIINQHMWGLPRPVEEGGVEIRGYRNAEYYENILDHTGGKQTCFGLGGGEVCVFNNRILHYIEDKQNAAQESWCYLRHNCKNLTWVGCDGGYPLPDQITNSYFWGNILNGVPYNTPKVVWVDPSFIQEGRDYWLEPRPNYEPVEYPHPMRKFYEGGIMESVKEFELVITQSPGFDLIGVPDTQEVGQGQAGQLTVSFNPFGGFAGMVGVNVEELPAGVTATVDKPQIAVGEQAVITLAVAPDAPLGSYKFKVRGVAV